MAKAKFTWSKNFDDYASGSIAVSQIVCVKCNKAPCACTLCPQCEWSLAPGETCPRRHEEKS